MVFFFLLTVTLLVLLQLLVLKTCFVEIPEAFVHGRLLLFKINSTHVSNFVSHPSPLTLAVNYSS